MRKLNNISYRLIYTNKNANRKILFIDTFKNYCLAKQINKFIKTST